MVLKSLLFMAKYAVLESTYFTTVQNQVLHPRGKNADNAGWKRVSQRVILKKTYRILTN